MNQTEILTVQDIIKLVSTFYSKVQDDELLAPIFNAVIQENWEKHLEKMIRFWQTVLLEEHTYFGSPFPPHSRLPITSLHFERWVSIFNQNIDEHFTGAKAEESKWRASKMAQLFQTKIAYHQKFETDALF
ncbi:MAG: group III truncated hemoglobin [Sphingobacteriales bacterium]|nr:MAG: group III truncated hemoglobin [Sphingobacteriales bacterium]